MKKRKSTKTKATKPPAQSVAAVLGFPEGIQLPSPLELAKLAAALAPRDRSPDNETWPQFAIQSALHLYLEAAKFCHDHCHDIFPELLAAARHPKETEASLVPYGVDLPPTKKPASSEFPITFDQLLRALMPRVEKEGDRLHRFKQYIAADSSQAAKNDDERLVFAGGIVAKLKKQKFSEGNYDAYAYCFTRWWFLHVKNERADAGRNTRFKSKEPTSPKGPPPEDGKPEGSFVSQTAEEFSVSPFVTKREPPEAKSPSGT